MKFCDMPYQRVSYEEIRQRYDCLLAALRDASSLETCREVLRQRYALMDEMTPMELCYVRHDMDVNDPFYAKEQEYYDEIGPKLTELSHQFECQLLDSRLRDQFKEILGRQAFAMMEIGQLSFDSRLVPLQQEEQALLSRYNQLVSNAAVLWKGRRVKRALMAADAQSPDRTVRREAAAAISDSWEAQRTELEDIYELLVQNRHKQAQALGYRSYVEMSYHVMCRIGYGREEVRCFREQVKRELVPFYKKLEEQRRKRLGLEKLYSYDAGICFLDGNPKPSQDTSACLEAAREMYTRLSPETAQFIAFLLDHGLYDAEIRDGKRGGGYMTFFEKYRAPFIFANFDGTSENAYIMCHEGGHAFQGYLKRDEEIRERRQLTSEAAEVHAMAMECFTMPYMDLFFGQKSGDYRTMQLENAIRLIISECKQDEFQEQVYERPQMGAEERSALWARLDLEYFPGQDYGCDENLKQGHGWQRIPHMFCWPFYTVDYALAQVCALEYDRWKDRDFDGAWQSYLQFCRQTGEKSFPELVRDAGLDDPFAEGTLHTLIDWLQTQLL